MIIFEINKLERDFFPLAPVQLNNAANSSVKSFLRINFVISSVFVPPILHKAFN